jgi:tRNA A37 threonylcarbamoyladenosine dehydratase
LLPSPGSYEHRFGGLTRLYGQAGAQSIQGAHVAVVGIGGVGSWAAEALARSGVGQLSLIDWDDICYSNINRQVHALDGTIGRSKVLVMAERIAAINPDCRVHAVQEFFSADQAQSMITQAGFDGLIDAIDQLTPKCQLITTCKRAKIPIVSCGAAGGMSDPTRLEVKDLNHSINDPLLAQVRKKLRKDFGFTKKPKAKFKVDCVFSSENKVFPREDGSVCAGKILENEGNIGCDSGYGSASFVTGTAAFLAVGRILNKIVHKQRQTEFKKEN